MWSQHYKKTMMSTSSTRIMGPDSSNISTVALDNTTIVPYALTTSSEPSGDVTFSLLEEIRKRVLETGHYKMSGYPSGHTDLEVYSIAVAAIFLMAVIIGGNSIVIIAIFFEYSLQARNNNN